MHRLIGGTLGSDMTNGRTAPVCLARKSLQQGDKKNSKKFNFFFHAN